MSAKTQLNLFILAMAVMSISCFWLLIQNDATRSNFVSKCVIENQTLPNPRDVCTAKYELWRRGS